LECANGVVVGRNPPTTFFCPAEIRQGPMTTEATSAKTSTATACWNCGAATTDAHFCAACGKIQPLVPGTDYFAFLGLGRKLALDTDELEGRFHKLSWKLHPDRFVRASEYERGLSLERSSQLNDAYRTLREPVSRVEYLLASAGMRREGQHKQQAPPELLEEVFELNESLDELRAARQAGGDPSEMTALCRRLEEARGNFEEKLGVVDAELELLSLEWDRTAGDAATTAGTAGTESPSQRKLMERMNEVLNRRSYIRNLVHGVQKELAEV
jgi:molecular chaperone HscB